MAGRAVISVLLLTLASGGLVGCADRGDVRARQVAEEATANAEDDAACRAKGEPGSAAYDACREELAARRVEKTEIDYQKRRYFDRVLGAGTDGINDY